MPAAEDLSGAAADLALMIDAARAGGEIAVARRAAGFETWEKGGGQGPVTEVDLEVDRMLRAELTSARPDYGWLSEETEDDGARLRAERVWIVDPIDGTRAFASGEDAFGVSVALAEAGEVIASAVMLPARGELFEASRGGGARKNGAALTASARDVETGATALASKFGLKADRWPGGPPPVERHFRASLAWRLCLVAEGRFDASLSVGGVWEWDAAPALIAQEAGAAARDADGAPLRFNQAEPRLHGLIACAPALMPGFLRRLDVRGA
ncbi:MAG: 3'(2'),5'-bisphosphate nucleotidase CysQ [Pseudomonadota bacterium]